MTLKKSALFFFLCNLLSAAILYMGVVDRGHNQNASEVVMSGYVSSLPTALIFRTHYADVENFIELKESKVWFDWNGDGFIRHTPWFRNINVFLVRDKNKNGIIDDGLEFVGYGYDNAFLELKEHDLNKDGYITSEDPIYLELLVWVELFNPGVTDRNELQHLQDFQVAAISLHSQPQEYNIDPNAPDELKTAHITHKGTVIYSALPFDAYSVKIQPSDILSKNTDNSPLVNATYHLPDLRGFGQVSDLRRAMSDKPSLLKLVKEFVFKHALYENSATTLEDFYQILYAWADAENVVPESRGRYVDARKLAFLEKYLGKSFDGHPVGQENPVGTEMNTSGYRVNFAFDNLSKQLLFNLTSQISPYFSAVLQYEPEYAQAILVEDTKFSDLKFAEPNDNRQALLYWLGIVRSYDIAPLLLSKALNEVYRLQSYSDPETARLFNLLTTDEETSSGEGVIYFDDIAIGSEGDDLGGGNIPSSKLGNDILFGGSGIDTLGGWMGNDILIGGLGDDFLSAGSGNDIFVYNLGDGNDTYDTISGENIIYMGEDITPANIDIRKDGMNVVIAIKDNRNPGEIIVNNALLATGPVENRKYKNNIEFIAFEDGQRIEILKFLGLK